MKKRAPVSSIMTKKLITITPKDSLYDAERLFNKHHIRHIPVVENGQLVGMLSHSDLLRISFSDLDENDDSVVPIIYDMYTIPQVMTKVPVFVEENDTIKEAAEILSKHSFHSLPVLDKGKLVGIITTTDLINYLLDQY